MAWGAGNMSHIINIRIPQNDDNRMWSTCANKSCLLLAAVFHVCLFGSSLIILWQHQDHPFATCTQHNQWHQPPALLHFLPTSILSYGWYAFPSDSCEHQVCWVGVSETIGNFMTLLQNSYWQHQEDHSPLQPTSILLVTHLAITCRWTLLMLKPSGFIKSFHTPSPSLSHGEDFMAVTSDDASDLTDNDSHHMSILCANELVGHTFLMDPREDGQCHHAHIVEFIKDQP